MTYPSLFIRGSCPTSPLTTFHALHFLILFYNIETKGFECRILFLFLFILNSFRSGIFSKRVGRGYESWNALPPFDMSKHLR